MLIAALRLLVCGGREYEDRKAVFRALDEVQNDPKVIEVYLGSTFDMGEAAS